jgi:aryl-alcohol dehydrogenase-like predicted oxidoreductase
LPGSPENRERNQQLIDTLQRLAADKGCTASQLPGVVKGTAIVPLIGARTRTQLVESLGALPITLAPAELERIEGAIPTSAVAGTRYDERQMRILDSERS